MYGNTPFGGNPTTTPAGQRSPNDTISLSDEEKDKFKQDLHSVEAAIGRHLPSIYTVTSSLMQTPAGVQGLIAIEPPIGQPIGAGIAPPMDDGELVAVEKHKQIAQDVVAAAVTAIISRTNSEPPKVAR
ncbi:DUF5811 family protein [Halosimplex pelagicum]|uniref:Uncharacterized protein n=1 Tax=Halosimplex pelagicum TaxID=869886 RepID=A0A7D5PBF4_9EURY|nr:DUF5811 family protein [Halosimplex pelagicum]QLH82222.1 hypothetical protein HZS54_11655 [Halosimplex pelagicum]